MIVDRYLAERSRGQLMHLTALIHSVFSEALDAPVTKFMDLTALSGSVFLDFTAINQKWIFLLQIVKFCEFDRRENEAANLFVASLWY